MCAALCRHYDVIWSCDVIGHMTIRLSVGEFLHVINRNQISLTFHDVMISFRDI